MNATNTPDETLAFLRCILPEETAGDFYCALVIEGGKRRQFFFQTIEKLAACIIEHDRQGRTVYHACASFKDPQGPTAFDQKGKWHPRAAQNAARAKAAWLDIDAGPGKAYPGPREAADALRKFCQKSGLPVPCLMGSGGGLHAYWPFDQACAVAEWRAIGERLKAACVAHGFHADPARTADISSVLRTPGTHNYKYGDDNVVKLITALHTYRQEDFRSIVGVECSGKRFDTSRSRGHASRGRLIDAVLRKDRADFGDAYVERISDQCAQLARFRETGDIPEPLYHACVGVTAWCTDGKVKTHEFAQRNYPDYDATEVDGRMERVLDLSGPTTCGKFQSINPSGCSGCAHRGKISTPIQLGAPDLDKNNSMEGALPAGVEVADGSQELPNLVEGFAWSPSKQLVFEQEDNNGVVVGTLVVNEPLYLVDVQRSEVGRPKHSYLLHHFFPKEGWRYVSINASQMFASNALAYLAEQGIIIHDAKLWFKYVRDTVSAFHQNASTSVRYDQFGWKEGNFYCGNYLYTPAGKVSVTGSGEVANYASLFGPQRPGASLVLWTEAADALFGAHNALGCGILAAFASPLISMLMTTNGGAILHLYSKEGGRGKTWARDGAASVWGNIDATKLLNEYTKVSKSIRMGTLCHIMVHYDELSNKDPAVVRDLVAVFNEGEDRLRGTQDGGTRQVAMKWRLIMLSNSNHDMNEVLTTAGVDAQALRQMQLDCPPVEFDKEEANNLKRRLTDNCGTAIDKYLQYLVNPEVNKQVRAMLDAFHDQIWKETKLGSEYRFRVSLVACLLAAGVITRHLDILHFDIERIRDYLLKELVNPTSAGHVSSQSPADTAKGRLGEFLNTHMGEVLTVTDKFKPGRGQNPVTTIGNIPRARIAARHELATDRLYISHSVLREWCTRNQISFRELSKELYASKIVLEHRKKVTLTAGTNMPGSQIDCVEIDMGHEAMQGPKHRLELVVIEQQAALKKG